MVLRLREPARLINSDSTDEFTLRLLEAAAFDQPTARAVSDAPPRVAALMAQDRDLVVATHVRAVPPSSKLHSIRPETKRVTRAAAVGILLGTSLAAAVVGVNHSTMFVKATPPAASMRLPVAASSTRHSRPAALRAAPVPTTEEVTTPAPSIQPRETKPIKAATHDLGQELALLDAAKADLSSGNPQGALRELDDAARLPRRVLAPEATVLRVKALVALNQTAQARYLVQTFVAQHPSSPVNAILRDLVAPFEKQ
jgi:hypothetical protein